MEHLFPLQKPGLGFWLWYFRYYFGVCGFLGVLLLLLFGLVLGLLGGCFFFFWWDGFVLFCFVFVEYQPSQKTERKK